MSYHTSMRVVGPVVVVIAALALGACGSMTTYGTGTTAAAQTYKDISGIVALGNSTRGEKPIDYSKRVPIVEPPPSAVLPEPGSGGTGAVVSNWPKDPDEERKRQDAVVAGLIEDGKTPRFTLPETVDKAPRKKHHDDLTLTEKYLAGKQNVGEQKKLFASAKLAKSGSFDKNGNPVRRYLTEPPVDYREPDPESSVEITEKPKKKNRFKFPDLWPF